MPNDVAGPQLQVDINDRRLRADLAAFTDDQLYVSGKVIEAILTRRPDLLDEDGFQCCWELATVLLILARLS